MCYHLCIFHIAICFSYLFLKKLIEDEAVYKGCQLCSYWRKSLTYLAWDLKEHSCILCDTSSLCFLFFKCLWSEVKWRRSVVSDSATRGLQPTKLLRPWDSPGKDTGVGYHFLLQGIFPTQGSNPVLSYCRQTLQPLHHQGSPYSSVYMSISVSRFIPSRFAISFFPTSVTQYLLWFICTNFLGSTCRW